MRALHLIKKTSHFGEALIEDEKPQVITDTTDVS